MNGNCAGNFCRTIDVAGKEGGGTPGGVTDQRGQRSSTSPRLASHWPLAPTGQPQGALNAQTERPRGHPRRTHHRARARTPRARTLRARPLLRRARARTARPRTSLCAPELRARARLLLAPPEAEPCALEPRPSCARIPSPCPAPAHAAELAPGRRSCAHRAPHVRAPACPHPACPHPACPRPARRPHRVCRLGSRSGATGRWALRGHAHRPRAAHQRAVWPRGE